MTTTTVHGRLLDDETRCAHWHTELDVIAIRFACCGEYYACRDCHDELAEHEPAVWPAGDRSTRAVLCGVCETELTIGQYAAVEACPACASEFNPGCRLHWNLYFGGTP